MTRQWCPRCKQSYFEPGSTPKVYACVDGTLHPATFVVQGEPITTPQPLVLKRMK